MPYVIARKPSGVLHVVTLANKREWVLYDLAIHKFYEIGDDAEKECKQMNKERAKRHVMLKKTQIELPLVTNV